MRLAGQWHQLRVFLDLQRSFLFSRPLQIWCIDRACGSQEPHDNREFVAGEPDDHSREFLGGSLLTGNAVLFPSYLSEMTMSAGTTPSAISLFVREFFQGAHFG
jgi:hypothetical protein